MKPNFALTLSFEGIGLLHRAFPGWHLVGEVSFDDSDLATDLKAIRDKALALDPSGLRTKLVIPNDQIKYLRFDAADRNEDTLRDAVRAHLQDATPYSVDDLAFDWSLEDGTVLVAAVAKETLSEAEAFSNEHEFHPISFVATPENGDFSGEPFFGETEYAARFLPEGEKFERDASPIRIIGAARLPDPEIPPENGEGAVADTSVRILEDVLPNNHTVDVPAPGAALIDSLDAAKPDTRLDETDAETTIGAKETGIAAFSSIRARRGDIPNAAPRLEGAERDISVPPAPAEPAETPEPEYPDFEGVGISDAALPIDPQQDLSDTVKPVLPEFGASGDDPAVAKDSDVFSTRRSLYADPGSALPHKPLPADAQQAGVATVFGAQDAIQVGGKPRYLGLILTAVLLLFLVGVAAWASIFLDDGLARFFRDDQDQQIADVPDLPVEKTNEPIDKPDTVVASLPDPDIKIDTGIEEALTQPKPTELTSDEARARYAATGIWQMAPQGPQAPSPDNLDDFYLTSIDETITSHDAVALPGLNSLLADTPPNTPGSPAVAGTTFDLDARGLVVATRSGAMTPDGILIYAGRPEVVPPSTPARKTTPEEPEVSDEQTQQLAAIRPRSRPGDLSEQNERGILSGRTRTELAALRPKLRPQSSQEAAATDATPNPFIDLDAVNQAVSQAVETEDPFASATPQAVSASLKPLTRPRNFDSIVQRSAQPQPEAVAVSAAQKIAPRIPTTTSVAKQATQRNVLKMRKVNLIGVYGTPNSRRALVRLSNGRYLKVKVGDRLDGGKVSAIGDHELRYQKSGRNVVLKMPKG